jgi:nucleoside-diphosphate-sugar epimerase
MYHALDETRFHKNVDNIILAAGKRGKIDAVIVCPPTIWGIAQGVFNTRSIQVPAYINQVLQMGEGFVLEDGINTWSHININDLSDAYLVILDAAVSGKLPSNSDERYLFVESDEYEQRELNEAATKALYEKGFVKRSSPVKITVEEASKYHEKKRNAIMFTGGNSRSRAVRLREWGWEPKRGGTKEFLESIKDDVEHAVKGKST